MKIDFFSTTERKSFSLTCSSSFCGCLCSKNSVEADGLVGRVTSQRTSSLRFDQPNNIAICSVIKSQRILAEMQQK
jgi:hypothetical protein